MSEEVSTGGLKSFRYPRGEQPKLSEEQRQEIAEAYTRAEERKRLEKRNKIIIFFIIILIILALGLYLILK